MGYAEDLKSGSWRRQVWIAYQLRHFGVEAYEYIPLLLEVSRNADRGKLILSWADSQLLNAAGYTMGMTLSAVGYDESNPLHCEVRDWLLLLTHESNPEVVAGAIYALGAIESASQSICERLCEIAGSERRPYDHPIVTARALALRVLGQLNPYAAIGYANTEAAAEYLNCIEHWLAHTDAKRVDALKDQLAEESVWLRRD